MNAALFTSCALVGVLAVGMGWWFVKRRLPTMIMPFARLSEEAQARVARRKFYWRGAALAAFILAAVALFSGLPRGVTLLCVCIGFFSQYKVFCLRRCYPVTFVPSMFSEE